jgi:hypothetical protein
MDGLVGKRNGWKTYIWMAWCVLEYILLAAPVLHAWSNVL